MIRKSAVTAVGFGDRLCFWCPGCDEWHVIAVPEHPGNGKGPIWSWSGDYERPTVSPSIRATGEKHCHSFIRDGQWQFLPDCTHTLAGQTVPLAPIPEGAA